MFPLPHQRRQFPISWMPGPESKHLWWHNVREQTPLVAYVRSRQSISTTMSLGQGQSAILAFATSGQEKTDTPLYVVSRSGNVARFHLNDGHIEAFIDDANEASVLLSDDTEVTIPASESRDNPAPLPTMPLGPWRLTVDSYAAPINLSSSSVVARRTTVAVATPLQTLVPWTRIRGLEQISGVGTYNATFSLPSWGSNGTTLSYTLHFTGKILHTIRVRVNGVLVPAIDPSAPDEGETLPIS